MRPQTDTHTQTRVTTTHFASSMTHSKCNKRWQQITVLVSKPVTALPRWQRLSKHTHYHLLKDIEGNATCGCCGNDALLLITSEAASESPRRYARPWNAWLLPAAPLAPGSTSSAPCLWQHRHTTDRQLTAHWFNSHITGDPELGSCHLESLIIIIIIIIIRKFITRTCSQALSMNRRRGQSIGGLTVCINC